MALSHIRKIYRIEKEGKRLELSAEELVVLRRERAKPILENFSLWLSKKAKHVTPKSLLGIAVNYMLNQWNRLTVYMEHGEVTPDNNLAENAIRPFVVGRKNWLFSGNPEGAAASAAMYSLIETAKVNGLDAYKYKLVRIMKNKFLITQLLIASAFSTNTLANDITIALTGFKLNKPIFISIYDNEDNYLKPELAAYKKEFPFNKNGKYVLKDIKSGNYTLTIFQDINGNKMLDKSLIGIPKEPYGFSNNASAGLLGPPSFIEGNITISNNVTIQVDLK